MREVLRPLFVVTILFCCSLTYSEIKNSVLTNDWISGQLHTSIAKKISQKIESIDCSTSPAYFYQFRNWGFGSELHIYSQALCNALELNATLFQHNQSWIWNEKQTCVGRELQPLRCYFNVENRCPWHGKGNPTPISISNDFSMCPSYIRDEQTRVAFRSAVMEILFSRLSENLVQEANDEARYLFRNYSLLTGLGADDVKVPNEMITVHIRAGDKAREMRLVADSSYIAAVDDIIQKFQLKKPFVYVVTENTEAWNRFSHAVEQQNRPWRATLYKHGSNVTEPGLEWYPVNSAYASGGMTGKMSLISLLIAMEAKFYVLTTGSNWSRLINELRTNILDTRCGNCTYMVDLNHQSKYGNWRK